jgi:hypothetical protein
MAGIFSIPDEICGLPKRITITFRLAGAADRQQKANGSRSSPKSR